MKVLVIMAAIVVFLAFIFTLAAAASCKSDDEKKDEDREQEEWILKTRKEKKMENQQERINKFMSLMTEASQATGITYAVEQGQALVVFDLVKNEPVELEIVVGTEAVRENGQTSFTTFDRSNVE